MGRRKSPLENIATSQVEAERQQILSHADRLIRQGKPLPVMLREAFADAEEIHILRGQITPVERLSEKDFELFRIKTLAGLRAAGDIETLKRYAGQLLEIKYDGIRRKIYHR